jgi:phosphatidylglycerophosphate synthase
MALKSWDSRIAHYIILPLRNTPVTPNHLTSLGLISGIVGGILFSCATPACVNWAALLFIISSLMDHCDGELARMTGKSTQFGLYYDHLASAANFIAFFIGAGVGLRQGSLSHFSLILGVIAAMMMIIIFALRMVREYKYGKESITQLNYGGFEIEDYFYLVGPFTWVGLLLPFFAVTSIGLIFYVLWELWLSLRKTRAMK